MKKQYIVHRSVDDNPEIPAVYSHVITEKSSESKEWTRKKWSRLRRENFLTLLGQMYEDDGKEATDAFLLDVIRSY